MNENNINYDNVNAGINPFVAGFIGGAVAVGAASLINLVKKKIREKRERGNIEIRHER